MDYSRWDSLSADLKAEEVAEKEANRRRNKENYYKQQKEKEEKWKKEKAEKEKRTTGESKESGQHQHHHHEHSHDHHHHHHPEHEHEHEHHHHHQHEHQHSHSDSPAPSTTSASPSSSVSSAPSPRRMCGCGYISPEQIAELKAQAENPNPPPELSTAEKNQRKMTALYACRDHGKELFGSKQYAEALQVYERGLLILTGMLDTTPEQVEEIHRLEVNFNMNMALCQYFRKEYLSAIDYCKSVLQLEPKFLKAFYRLAAIYIEMADLDKAREWNEKAEQLEPANAEVKRQKDQIAVKERVMNEKEKLFEQKLKEKMKKHAKSLLEEEELVGKNDNEKAVSASTGVESKLAGVGIADADKELIKESKEE